MTDLIRAFNVPSTQWLAITPHDTTEVTLVNGKSIRGLYVGQAGHVTVVGPNGDTCEFRSVPVGTILPIRPKLVMSTGTTAAYLVGIY